MFKLNFHPLLKRASVGTGIWWYLHCEIFRDVSGSVRIHRWSAAVWRSPQLQTASGTGHGAVDGTWMPGGLCVSCFVFPWHFHHHVTCWSRKTQPLPPRIPQTPAIYWCIALKQCSQSRCCTPSLLSGVNTLRTQQSDASILERMQMQICLKCITMYHNVSMYSCHVMPQCTSSPPWTNTSISGLVRSQQKKVKAFWQISAWAWPISKECVQFPSLAC